MKEGSGYVGTNRHFPEFMGLCHIASAASFDGDCAILSAAGAKQDIVRINWEMETNNLMRHPHWMRAALSSVQPKPSIALANRRRSAEVDGVRLLPHCCAENVL